MGISRGIAAFLEGAMQGQQVRQQWEDRKAQKAIEQEDRQWAREDRAIAAEDRKQNRADKAEDAAWVREQRAVVRANRDKEKADAAEEKKVFADALSAAQKDADEGVGRSLTDDGTAKPKKKAKPAAGRSMAPASGKPGAAPAGAPSPSVPPTPDASYAAGVTPGAGQAPTPPAAIAPAAPPIAAGQMAAPPAPVDPQQPDASALIAPTQGPPQEPMAQAIALSRPGPDYQARSMPARAAALAPQAPPAPAQQAAAGRALPQDPMQAAIAMSAPADAPAQNLSLQPAPGAQATPPSPLVDPGTGRALSMPQAAARTPGPAALQMPSFPKAADGSNPVPSRVIVPSDAPGDPAPTTPSIQIAASTRSVAPAAPGAGTEGHVDDFMTRYRKEAVPMIVQHYLGKGELEKAKEWQAWSEDSAAKDGMRAWAKGVSAAAAGDEDGFMNSMIEAYNSNGYFDDGYQVIRKDSGFTRDEGGAITGARLTFKNQKTGAISSRVFEDVDDIYRLGVNFLSPEQVFEYGQKQMAAASEAQAKEAAHERAIEIEILKAKISGKSETDYRKALANVTKTLMETDLSGAFASLPPDQQVAQAAEIVRAQEEAVTSLGQRGLQRQELPVWRGE